jgi:hypothetical protein
MSLKKDLDIIYICAHLHLWNIIAIKIEPEPYQVLKIYYYITGKRQKTAK